MSNKNNLIKDIEIKSERKERKERKFQRCSMLLIVLIAIFIFSNKTGYSRLNIASISYVTSILLILFYKRSIKNELAIPTVKKFVVAMISFSFISIIVLPKVPKGVMLLDTITNIFITYIFWSVILWFNVEISDKLL